jgi:hypothetical protein
VTEPTRCRASPGVRLSHIIRRRTAAPDRELPNRPLFDQGPAQASASGACPRSAAAAPPQLLLLRVVFSSAAKRVQDSLIDVLRRSCAGTEGDQSAGSGPPIVVAVPDLGQENHFLARTIRGIAYVEDVEPVAA